MADTAVRGAHHEHVVHEDRSDSGMGMLIGVILLIVVVALFIIYGLPLLQGPSVQVPGQVDVNVQGPQ